ncbi:hypothetical protein WN944_015647 [Citrus x changshan-huyou]|uniref:Uncharacterized protein n=1 Tax=Citrus x changshan-huyou TaxID=2935761 RepID=A0AAP0QMS8_9ROSI
MSTVNPSQKFLEKGKKNQIEGNFETRRSQRPSRRPSVKIDENEIVWQDDNYIRPIKDIETAEREEAVFKDISPLIVLVHNRYKRPKENERIRDELEKAVHIIWNCRLPSPRVIDANIEHDLVSALQVSVFPEDLCSFRLKAWQQVKPLGMNEKCFGYSWRLLWVLESHQAGKLDTSGTAKAVISSFQKLRVSFDMDQDSYIL